MKYQLRQSYQASPFGSVLSPSCYGMEATEAKEKGFDFPGFIDFPGFMGFCRFYLIFETL